MGSKYKLLDKLIPLFPKNKEVFLDLFTGSGVVYMNVNHLYNKVISNDILSDLIDIHKNIKNKNYIEKAISNSIKTKYSQEEYLKLREDYNSTKDSSMLLSLIWSCNSNMMRFNNNFIFNQTWGKRCFNKNTQKKLDILQDKNFDNVKFISYDFYDIGLKADKNTFVYLDPPYFNTEAGYNSFWNINNENSLIHLLKYYIDNDIKFGISGVDNGKPNNILEFLKNYKLEIYWFGDLYQKISKKDKINNEYYITNCKVGG